jgi:(4S)-4-hydroxy-5-phosphonooxypentane-2,3-dione isomerase
MRVTCVTVYVKHEFVDAFVAATVENHNGSVREAGNLRFDVLQHGEDPCRFLLYEAYESDEAAAEHKKTAHYLKWKDAVTPWMAQAREGVTYKIVCPVEKKRWK